MESNSGSGTISTILYETASVTLQIVSVIFNVAIICTLSKKSLIRCPSNKFVFSLCLSHLFASILSLLISAIQFFGLIETKELISVSKFSTSSQQEKEVSLHFILSHLLLYLTLTAVIGSSINVCVISVERYITIAHPMKYNSIVTPTRCNTIILICWILSVVIVLLPIFFSGNQTVLNGSFAIPNGRLGQYYGIVFSSVTFIVLSVMILCYLHIFMIAKAKCQKVQIGHFTSPISSISSDWPSTAYSSQAEGHPACQFKCSHLSSPQALLSSGNQKYSSPNSLLQYVLLANLGRHTQSPLRVPYALPLNELSAEGKIAGAAADMSQKGSTGATDTLQIRLTRTPQNDFHHHHHHHSQPQRERGLQTQSTSTPVIIKPKRWRTFLKQNYNSPRKTISTIVILIGSLILTQLPLSVALFFPTRGSSLFYFCFKHLLPFSSLTNPILYGFLNRTIRVHLLKFLRIRRRHRGFNLRPKHVINNRKASFSSSDGHFLKREISLTIDDDKISIKSLNIGQFNNHNINNNKKIYTGPDRENMEYQLNVINTNCSRLSVDSENNISQPQAYHQQNYESSHCHLNTSTPSESIIDENPLALVEDELVVPIEEPHEPLASNFPRKPSQDSGVDVIFSEDEDDYNGSKNEIEETT